MSCLWLHLPRISDSHNHLLLCTVNIALIVIGSYCVSSEDDHCQQVLHILVFVS